MSLPTAIKGLRCASCGWSLHYGETVPTPPEVAATVLVHMRDCPHRVFVHPIFTWTPTWEIVEVDVDNRCVIQVAWSGGSGLQRLNLGWSEAA